MARGRHLRFRSRFWSLSAVLVTINVAGLLWIRHELTSGPVPAIRVLAATPTGAADGADRFALQFDEPLGRPEQIGRPLEWTPFRVEPEPPGAWVYAAPDRLEFVLDEPLPAGR
ncbi:MAG: hypothetical protein ACYTJ0_09010, partial [Planctomycetota bacterium]